MGLTYFRLIVKLDEISIQTKADEKIKQIVKQPYSKVTYVIYIYVMYIYIWQGIKEECSLGESLTPYWGKVYSKINRLNIIL